jgi:uncharacterized protein YkwD
MTVNPVDVLLLLIVLFSIWNGWRRGFILSSLDLLQWLGSGLLALRFYKSVANFLRLFLNWSDVWLLPFAFLLVVILTSALIHYLGYLLVKRLPKGTHQKRLNRVFGLFPGMINGLVTAAIFASLLLVMPFSEALHKAAGESYLTNRLAESTSKIETALSPIFDEAIARSINLLTVRPESNERVDLPFKVANPQPKPNLEAQMLALVNNERAKVGLGTLAPDSELTEVARHHSADMFARGYFSHLTPESKSPFDRMHEAGVTFSIAGENLALAPTLSLAHTGLMNSPGHRANILRPQFGRLGVGILDGGIRGLMVTQNFRN